MICDQSFLRHAYLVKRELHKRKSFVPIYEPNDHHYMLKDKTIPNHRPYYYTFWGYV